MAVRRDPKRGTWFFVIDLPAGPDGKRRQMYRRGFATEALAAREERAARQQFSRASLSADGTVAAGADPMVG